MVLFVFISRGSFSDKNIFLLAKIIFTLYLIILSIFVIKGRDSGNKIGYYNLMMVGVIASYFLTPYLGFIIPAYLTTFGKGKNNEPDITII